MQKPKTSVPLRGAVAQPKTIAGGSMGPVRPPAPPVYRVPPPVVRMQPAAVRQAPPVYRPAAGAPQLRPNIARPAPPVYRASVAQRRVAPPFGVVQRLITAEQADEIVRGNPMKVNDLKAYIQDLSNRGKLPVTYDATQEEELLIGKALIKVGLRQKKKKEADDITSVYNARFACVLQAVIYIKGAVFGKASPKDLHDLIWSDKSKAQYRQYDDDSVTPDFYRAAGLNPVAFAADSTMETLPDTLANGKYAVGVKGSVEDHMYILDKTGKNAFAWKEFDQINLRGFQDARINKNGKIDSVYG